jgi:hypothetical protein
MYLTFHLMYLTFHLMYLMLHLMYLPYVGSTEGVHVVTLSLCPLVMV